MSGQNSNTTIAIRNNEATSTFPGSTDNNGRQMPRNTASRIAITRIFGACFFMIPSICLITFGAMQLDEDEFEAKAFIVFGAVLFFIAAFALVQYCVHFHKQSLIQQSNSRRATSRSNENGNCQPGQINVAYINYPLPELAEESALPSYEAVTKESAPPSYEEAIHDTDEPS
ncbi:uncharacterized protein LOC143447389 isoform X1 [Clavelina lepadiformis]|uniref:Uncharacterized protein n=1 Tax=Clavelina lepadiformis TaxID=159417 RepID=A0ABP0GS27_CLALP